MLDFVDFEYFGWDDPAKTIVDFLLHPGMQLDDALKRRFAAGVCAAFAELPALPARTRIVYPLFGLKWGLILLNDFLPERAGQAPGARPAAQLAKARSLVSLGLRCVKFFAFFDLGLLACLFKSNRKSPRWGAGLALPSCCWGSMK